MQQTVITKSLKGRAGLLASQSSKELGHQSSAKWIGMGTQPFQMKRNHALSPPPSPCPGIRQELPRSPEKVVQAAMSGPRAILPRGGTRQEASQSPRGYDRSSPQPRQAAPFPRGPCSTETVDSNSMLKQAVNASPMQWSRKVLDRSVESRLPKSTPKPKVPQLQLPNCLDPNLNTAAATITTVGGSAPGTARQTQKEGSVASCHSLGLDYQAALSYPHVQSSPRLTGSQASSCLTSPRRESLPSPAIDHIIVREQIKKIQKSLNDVSFRFHGKPMTSERSESQPPLDEEARATEIGTHQDAEAKVNAVQETQMITSCHKQMQMQTSGDAPIHPTDVPIEFQADEVLMEKISKGADAHSWKEVSQLAISQLANDSAVKVQNESAIEERQKNIAELNHGFRAQTRDATVLVVAKQDVAMNNRAQESAAENRLRSNVIEVQQDRISKLEQELAKQKKAMDNRDQAATAEDRVRTNAVEVLEQNRISELEQELAQTIISREAAVADHLKTIKGQQDHIANLEQELVRCQMGVKGVSDECQMGEREIYVATIRKLQDRNAKLERELGTTLDGSAATVKEQRDRVTELEVELRRTRDHIAATMVTVKDKQDRITTLERELDMACNPQNANAEIIKEQQLRITELKQKLEIVRDRETAIIKEHQRCLADLQQELVMTRDCDLETINEQQQYIAKLEHDLGVAHIRVSELEREVVSLKTAGVDLEAEHNAVKAKLIHQTACLEDAAKKIAKTDAGAIDEREECILMLEQQVQDVTEHLNARKDAHTTWLAAAEEAQTVADERIKALEKEVAELKKAKKVQRA